MDKDRDDQLADFEAFREWQRGAPEPGPKPQRWSAPSLVAIGLAVLTLLGMVLLRPTGETKSRIDEVRSETDATGLGAVGVPSQFYEARVELAEDQPCSVSVQVDCRHVAFVITEGPDEGDTFIQEFALQGTTTPEFEVGERVVLSYLPDAPEDFQYQFSDRQRRSLLVWIGAGFAVAVIALGRWRGLAALGGLAASLLVLFLFVLPAIIDGRSPVLVAVVGASAIAYLALYVAHGFKLMTTVALLGTLASLGITALLSAFVTSAARFSGLVDEEVFFLTLVPGTTIDIRGLILAGIVLGALGAIDDVTVTQASAVWQLRKANPGLKRLGLFRSGIAIGRDHIASTVNTLVLAYAGAAMPLLLLFVLADQSLASIANSEIVSTEIVRTLVGSIGLVAAVPITTWLAAHFASAEPPG